MSNNNRSYILCMILMILLILILPRNNTIETFGCAWYDVECKIREAWEWALAGAMRDINNMINQLKSFNNTVTNFPKTIPATAKNISDSAINIGLTPPRLIAQNLKNSLNGKKIIEIFSSLNYAKMN